MAMLGPTTDQEQIRAWAELHDVVPVEALPHIVDHEPASMRLIHRVDLSKGEWFRLLSWPEFFSRFELFGLSVVYDSDETGYNELLQIEEKSPYRNPKYSLIQREN